MSYFPVNFKLTAIAKNFSDVGSDEAELVEAILKVAAAQIKNLNPKYNVQVDDADFP